MEFLIVVDGEDAVRPVLARSAEEALDLVRQSVGAAPGTRFRFLPAGPAGRRLFPRRRVGRDTEMP